jgi:hypothetical protein
VIIVALNADSTGATISQYTHGRETVTTVGRRPGAIASAAAHDLLNATGVATAGYAAPGS